jgi:hypothetical protein
MLCPIQEDYTGRYRVEILSRFVYPYDVENQKESVICARGDYTYMRNTMAITDDQPNFPSAMFRSKEDRVRAEEEYTKAVYSVREYTERMYRAQFTHSPFIAKQGSEPTRGTCTCVPMACVYTCFSLLLCTFAES